MMLVLIRCCCTQKVHYWRMEKMENVDQILRQFGYVFSTKHNLSQFGGLKIFMDLLAKAKLRERLRLEFGDYKARSLLQMMIGIVGGAKTMNDIGAVAKDPLVASFLGNPVEEAQLGRDVRKFSRAEIEALHDFCVSCSVLDFVREISHNEELVFDIDATSVIKYGEQEGVNKGYVGADNPDDCYQYLLIRIHNRNTFLYGTIREGSSHSQNNLCGYLERFLPMLKDKWKSAWRGDSGYYNEDAFDLFSTNDARFFVKAPMIPARLNMAETSPDLHWRVIQKANKENRFTEISFAERSTNTKKGTKFREVFKRTQKSQWGQMSLGDLGDSVRFDCIATNDFALAPEAIFDFYNGRANIENNIRDLKQDYALGKIITEKFDANDVITQVTLLTYLFIQHLKIKTFPPQLQRQTLSTLRNRLFNIPSSIFRESRKVYLRLQNVFCQAPHYAQILAALATMQSWLVFPPEISS